MNINTEFNNILQKIKQNSKYLRLSYSYHNSKQLIDEHSTLNSSIPEFYDDLLKRS